MHELVPESSGNALKQDQRKQPVKDLNFALGLPTNSLPPVDLQHTCPSVGQESQVS